MKPDYRRETKQILENIVKNLGVPKHQVCARLRISDGTWRNWTKMVKSPTTANFDRIKELEAEIIAQHGITARPQVIQYPSGSPPTDVERMVKDAVDRAINDLTAKIDERIGVLIQGREKKIEELEARVEHYKTLYEQERELRVHGPTRKKQHL